MLLVAKNLLVAESFAIDPQIFPLIQMSCAQSPNFNLIPPHNKVANYLISCNCLIDLSLGKRGEDFLYTG
jgi:hypothetical protein